MTTVYRNNADKGPEAQAWADRIARDYQPGGIYYKEGMKVTITQADEPNDAGVVVRIDD